MRHAARMALGHHLMESSLKHFQSENSLESSPLKRKRPRCARASRPPPAGTCSEVQRVRARSAVVNHSQAHPVPWETGAAPAGLPGLSGTSSRIDGGPRAGVRGAGRGCQR